MRDFSCFTENAVQVADSSSSNGNKTAQNLVSCVYQCRFRGRLCVVTVTWSKNLMGQVLSIEIHNPSNQCLCKVEIKPWLFSKRKGSKTLEIESSIVDIYWDLSSATFGSGLEPLEGFYLAIISDRQMILLLGDMRKEALRKTNVVPGPCTAVFIAKREHVYGKKTFSTKAQFSENGRIHDLKIECDTISTHNPCLIIYLDSKNLLQVKRVRWKFRGNGRILVDGQAVEVFWDVYSWLFGTSPGGSGVFMFWSEPVSDSSVLQWSNSQRFGDSESNQLGFSLILHAWKQE